MGLGASLRKAGPGHSRRCSHAAHTTASDRPTLRACTSASGRHAREESAMDGSQRNQGTRQLAAPYFLNAILAGYWTVSNIQWSSIDDPMAGSKQMRGKQVL